MLKAAIYAVTALGIAIVFANFAKAEPPPEETVWTFDAPYLVCDTREQVEEIVKAGQGSDTGAFETYMRYFMLPNERQERTCEVVKFTNVAVFEAYALGKFAKKKDDFWFAWSVRFQTARAEYWMLYMEQVPVVQSRSASYVIEEPRWNFWQLFL